MKTLTINSTKQLKELVLGDPSWEGQRSLIIRNVRMEIKLFGEPISTRLFNIGGEYVRCKLTPELVNTLAK